MTEPDLATIMMTVSREILDDRALSFPWYRPEIRSEAQAQAAVADLPLLYSWNEVVQGGRLQSFSVSVNGGKLAAILQRHLPRSHPEFAEVRDNLSWALNEAQDAMLVRLCQEFQAPPSRVSAVAREQVGAA